MDDTSPEIQQKIIELIQQKTPTERVKMGFSMNKTARYLVTQAILRKSPQISEEDLRVELFLKYYGDDFDSAEKEKIILHLKNCK